MPRATLGLALALSLTLSVTLGGCLVGSTEFREAGVDSFVNIDVPSDVDAAAPADSADTMGAMDATDAMDVVDATDDTADVGPMDTGMDATTDDAMDQDAAIPDDGATDTDASIPDDSTGPLRVVQVTAGWFHTCALLSDGRVFCWGGNTAGQLGVGGTPGATPTEVPNVRASAISAGSVHTCAILSASHTLSCWGANDAGQLGDGTASGGSVPRPVVGLTGLTIAGVSAGARHTCAWTDTGQVWCFGANDTGQLGTGATSTTIQMTPLQVDAADGVTPLDQVTDVRASGGHTCVVRLGVVLCWGQNMEGELGINSMTPQYRPITHASGITDAVAVTAGSNHTCALRSTQQLVCWGRNVEGQLGVGDNNVRLVPNGVDTSHTYLSIAADAYFTCGVRADNAVFCWGKNNDGEIGNNQLVNFNAPTLVLDEAGTGPLTVDSVATAYTHACAVSPGGAGVVCWGSNRQGELGRTPTGGTRLAPGTVSSFF